MGVTVKMSVKRARTNFFIKPSSLKNFVSVAKKIFLTNILFKIFLGCCLQATDASASSANYEILFLENLMLRDGGLFTLLGSKPMILFNVTDDLERTEEEFVESYRHEKEDLEKVKQELDSNTVIPTYEEFKQKQLRIREAHQFRERKKIWMNWISRRGIISTPAYKLFERGNGDDKWGVFINVAQLQYLLNRYQKEFAQIVKVEFDPDTIVDSISDEDNIFWQKVFKNHFLLGILLGYGEKNAYLFDWARRNSLPLETIEIKRFSEMSRLALHSKEIFKKTVTVNDLVIPYFASFEIADQEMERYVREKEKIVNFLKDKDLITFVSKCLELTH